MRVVPGGLRRAQPGRIALAVTTVLVVVSIVGAAAPIESAPPPLAGLQYAYNRQNPRWGSDERSVGPSQLRKPYKPLRFPPGRLPLWHHAAAHGSPAFDTDVVAAVAGVVVVGAVVEWLASASQVPSALLAVTFGVLLGPGTGVIDAG